LERSQRFGSEAFGLFFNNFGGNDAFPDELREVVLQNVVQSCGLKLPEPEVFVNIVFCCRPGLGARRYIANSVSVSLS
jgi:hypothetical protein